MNNLIAQLFITASLIFTTALAQETPNAPEQPAPAEVSTPSSGVRFSIGGQLQAEFGSTFQGKLWPSNVQFTIKLEGSVGNLDFPTATFLINLRSSLNANGQTQVALREAQVNLSVGAFDLIVGNQIIAWGVNDVFNPLNTINPQDRSNPFEVKTQPALGVRGTYTIHENLKLEAVLIPGFQASTLPTGIYVNPLTPPLGATIVGVDTAQDKRPDLALENMQGGLRFGMNIDLLEGADLNLSYWTGWRTTPTANANFISVAPDQIRVQPVFTYDRVNIIGGDFTIAYKGFIGKLETAYTITHDMDGSNPNIGNPSFELAFQGEYSFVSGLQTIFSVDFNWVRGEGVGNDTYTLQTALVASYELDNRTTIEGVWVQNFTDGSGLLNAKLLYTLADGLSLYATGGLAYGTNDSSIGRISNASQLRFGLKFSF
jgi:opacity protein-like surface antigen